MTVKQLIEELSKFSQETEVFALWEDEDYKMRYKEPQIIIDHFEGIPNKCIFLSDSFHLD